MKTLDDMMQELPPARRAAIEARADELIAEELTLREMRQALDITQEEMARRLEIGQENVSRQERRGDLKISTLRSYVSALGGTLNLTVNIPGKPPIELKSVSGD